MYEKSKIYRIVCNTTGLQYVGSTVRPLCKRLSCHKKDYKRWQADKGQSYTTSFKVLENGNYDIVLVEEYPCDNKEQLHKRERYWIEQLDCVNKFVPARTSKEYYEANVDKVKAKDKAYYETNREVVLAKRKAYYEVNRESALKRLASPTTCECGCTVRRDSLARHRRSLEHQAWVAAQEPTPTTEK
jgi:hypothetical protein